MSQPDPRIVLELIEAFRWSKTMFAALQLGVFDFLARGPASLGAIAKELRSNPHGVERLLDGCAGLGLLAKTDHGYENTPVADVYLRRDSERTLAGYILYSNEVLFPMWAHLEDAVQEGSNRWAQECDPDKGLFAHFFRTDDSRRTFLQGMHGFGTLSSPVIVRAFDLSRFRRMVDLGGATGHLAIEAEKAYPQIRCAVFDLPEVGEVATEFIRRAGSKVEFIGGDFFRDSLPEADLYSLGRILHDWGEEKIRLLLGKIHDSLPPGGGLLICEWLLDDDKTGPVSALMQSLNMLVCTEGRERTLEEYTDLLHDAGFTAVEAKKCSPPLDVILAVRR